jgi:four helix bundle protein
MSEYRDSLLGRLTEFAVRVIHMVRCLPKDAAGWTLGRQVVRSSTSIVGNLEEAFGTCTRKDFLNKYATARKEARETYRWLLIIAEAGLLPRQRLQSILKESNEIVAILTKSIKTIESKM